MNIRWPAWMADANCVGTDPEEFFQDKGGSTRDAKRICARCTVAAECLDYALANHEAFGVFGGLSQRERQRIQHHTSDTHLNTQEPA